MKYRIEHDSIGSKEVPVDAYYGVQSLRGQENFQITSQFMRPEFIWSLAAIKKAAAIVNREVGILRFDIAGAIIKACDEILAGNINVDTAVFYKDLQPCMIPSTTVPKTKVQML